MSRKKRKKKSKRDPVEIWAERIDLGMRALLVLVVAISTPHKFIPTVWSVPIAIGLFLLVILSRQLLKLLSLLQPVKEAAVEHRKQVSNAPTRTRGVALKMALGGMAEEVLFRGVVQQHIGVVWTALLFGFAHGGWMRRYLPYAVFTAWIGLIFGVVYWQTNDLWGVMLGHGFVNLYAKWPRKERVVET